MRVNEHRLRGPNEKKGKVGGKGRRCSFLECKVRVCTINYKMRRAKTEGWGKKGGVGGHTSVGGQTSLELRESNPP